jgi:hypothetical protein
LFDVVDLRLRIRDRGVGIGPCEADFKRRKQDTIDDDWLQIRAPDPGVPQTFSSLERFNPKAVIIHCTTPVISAGQQITSPRKRM